MMNNEQFKSLIKSSIDAIEPTSDLKDRVMDSVLKEKVNRPRVYVHRPFLLVALVLICSTLIFASVTGFDVVHLMGSDNILSGIIKIFNTDENPHLDTHVLKEDLFRYTGNLTMSQEWQGKAFIVLDTHLDYPHNMDIRLKGDYKTSYNELSKIDGLNLTLPNQIMGYTFESLSYSYDYVLPPDEEIEALIKANKSERFIVKEIDSGDIRYISYTYKNTSDKLTLSASFKVLEAQAVFQVFTSTLKDYEVMRLDEIDVFVMDNYYSGVTYTDTGVFKHLSENNFETCWYENDKDMSVSVRANKVYLYGALGQKTTNEEGETVYLEVYPDYTKDRVVNFTKEVHRLLNQE